MVVVPKRSIEGIHHVEHDEWMQLVDETARRTLGLSGADFIAKYRAGEFGDADADPRVMWLAMMLPDAGNA